MRSLMRIAVLLSLVAALALPAAALADDVQMQLRQSSTIEKIMRSGKMRVGMSTFVPWAMQSKKGEWVGFEIDVAKKLAEDMEVKVEFVPTQWEGLIPGLLTGKFDLIIAGMMGTPQRALKINFTAPYDYSYMHIAAHKEVAKGVKSYQDLNREDVTLVCRNGTTAVPSAKKHMPKAQIRLFSDDGSMVQELLNGKAHAMVASSPQPAQLVAKNPDKLFLLDESLMKEPISIGVRKGDPDTIAYLNNWIVVLQAEGWLKDKTDYWWGGMNWLSLIE